MGVAKDIRKNFNLFVDGRGHAGYEHPGHAGG